MKKILLIIILLFGLNVHANILPDKTILKNTNSIGLYQVNNNIVLHKYPNETSDIVHSIKWNKYEVFPESLTFNDLFAVFMPNKSLALMTVIDENEDWVQVIYNNKTDANGWIKKDDPYKFLTWTNFYNMYGRKYGLYILKGAPDNIKELHSAPEEKSQIVARVNIPVKINLNVIRGNWALVSIMDLDRTPKTGYMRWRSDNGIKYLFPDIK